MPQIFVNLPFLQSTKILNFAAIPDGNEIYSSVLDQFPALETSRFLLFHQSKLVSDDFYFDDSNSMPITLTGLMPVLGGKGGFGSQLKALGNRIAQKKVTNYESSRDLSGRRLRTVNDAKKLADYIADAPKRKKEEEEKLEKQIKKAQQMKDTKVVKVDHSEYLEKLEKVEDDVESAVKKGKVTLLIQGLKKVPLKSAVKVTKKVQKKTSSAWKDDLSSSDEDEA